MKIENYKLKILIVSISVFLLFTSSKNNAQAFSPSSNNFDIEVQDIDTVPDKINPTPVVVTTTPVPPKQKDENLINSLPLSFSVSQDLIDFGFLTPGNPVSRVIELSVFGESIDYHILAFEDHPLTNNANEFIPDTTCDNGSCSQIKESPWTTNLTYGFGFRCDNLQDKNCFDFTENISYKQFADLSKKEQSQIITEGKLHENPKTANITFRLNSTVSQKPGDYSNTVTFIAIPNY